jgi:hypothetical protein
MTSAVTLRALHSLSEPMNTEDICNLRVESKSALRGKGSKHSGEGNTENCSPE